MNTPDLETCRLLPPPPPPITAASHRHRPPPLSQSSSAAVRRHPPLPPPLPAVIVVARRRHPRPARCCSPRPPPSHVPRSSGVRSMHPHPISRSLPSPSISILVADTLHLRPPLGGYISSLRRTSSRTLPKFTWIEGQEEVILAEVGFAPCRRGCLGLNGSQKRMESSWTEEALNVSLM